MKNVIFTISGEEDCFAEEIAQQLASSLNINCYNKQITQKASEISNINYDIIKSVDNWSVNNFISNIFVTPVYSSFSMHCLVNFEPIQQRVFMAKASALNELSKNNNCVIYSRCADYMLNLKKFNNPPNKNTKIINIFIYSDDTSKINNFNNLNSIPNNTYLKRIKKNYKLYKKYHEFYTSKNLDNRLLYDLMINTSNISVKRAVDIIKQLFL